LDKSDVAHLKAIETLDAMGLGHRADIRIPCRDRTCTMSTGCQNFLDAQTTSIAAKIHVYQGKTSPSSYILSFCVEKRLCKIEP